MSEISNKTDELFMAASGGDDDLGYPADVAFVPSDEEWTDDVLWRNLIEGQATVLSARTPSCCWCRCVAA
jgi:hypothetical protein